MSKSEFILWLDVETSGALPGCDVLLEVSGIITTMSGEKISNEYSTLIEQPNLSEIITQTDPKIIHMHDSSGLWEDLWNESGMSVNDADESIVMWLENYLNDESIVYLGGNSINLDRDFVKMYLPELFSRLSHRTIDMTSISLAISRNTSIAMYQHNHQHRALPDVRDSIADYTHFLNKIKYFNQED